MIKKIEFRIAILGALFLGIIFCTLAYKKNGNEIQNGNDITVTEIDKNNLQNPGSRNKELHTPNAGATRVEELGLPWTLEDAIYISVDEKVVTKAVTNLHTNDTMDSEIIVSVINGFVLNRTAIGSNGWSKLDYYGQTVYANSSYLTTNLRFHSIAQDKQEIVDNKLFVPNGDMVTAKEYVNLREYPNTNSKIIATLESGEFLQRTATSNSGWSRLEYNGCTVYAVTSYLSLTVVDPVIVKKVYDSEGYKIVDEQVTAKIETNLRTFPNTVSSEIVCTIKNGEYVKRIGIHGNGWSKLMYNEEILYAISSYLIQ